MVGEESGVIRSQTRGEDDMGGGTCDGGGGGGARACDGARGAACAFEGVESGVIKLIVFGGELAEEAAPVAQEAVAPAVEEAAGVAGGAPKPMISASDIASDAASSAAYSSAAVAEVAAGTSVAVAAAVAAEVAAALAAEVEAARCSAALRAASRRTGMSPMPGPGDLALGAAAPPLSASLCTSGSSALSVADFTSLFSAGANFTYTRR